MAEGTHTRPSRWIVRRAVAVAVLRAAESTTPVPVLFRGSFAGKFFPPGIRELFIHSVAALAILTLGAYAQFPLFAGNPAEMTDEAGSFGRFGGGGGDGA